MELKIKIKKVHLFRYDNSETIRITIDGASAFPVMKYDTIMKIECQQGYGEEYCRNELGLEPEILDIR